MSHNSAMPLTTAVHRVVNGWAKTTDLSSYLDSLENPSLSQQSLLSLGWKLEIDHTQYMGPVLNQGNCSNCWAQSMTQILSFAVNKFTP